MVIHCVVFKCSNRQGSKAKEKDVSFFRFPKDRKKRLAWIRAINRDDWTPNEYSRVCSEHFVDSWHSDDPTDINYRPTLFAYKSQQPSESQTARNKRLGKRNLLQEFKEQEEKEVRELQRHHNFSLYSHSYCYTDTTTDDVSSLTESTCISNPDLPVDDVNIKVLKDEGMQCDQDPLLVENMSLKKEVEELKKEVIRHKWSFQKISDDDSKTRFYTGLPSFAVFMWLFSILRPKAERMKYWSGPNTDLSSDRKRASAGSLDLIDQLFAVLIRLRVGLLTSDIAERFQISESTFSKYFSTWVCLLWQELKCLNPFPSRDIVQRTMPSSFKKRYSSVRVIIDCTEIYIQKPSSLVNQSLTFSNYKHHTTVKFLVGITPSGVISFVSEGWPGKTSDRELTISSGLVDLLDENDSVMADKGFTIRDVLLKKNCQLNIPPFRGSAPQFSTDEIFDTQEIASLRIHVERSIGRIKRFHIFDGVMPLTLKPLLTKIFQVVCWLTNLDVSMVSN